jgi:hypothetical protein
MQSVFQSWFLCNVCPCNLTCRENDI